MTECRSYWCIFKCSLLDIIDYAYWLTPTVTSDVLCVSMPVHLCFPVNVIWTFWLTETHKQKYKETWSPVQPSVIREYHPKIFELLHLLQCIAHYWLGVLERHNITVILVLVSIPTWPHAAENRSSACWRLCWEDASNTKSLAKSKRLILQLPVVTPSSTLLWLSIPFVWTTKGNGDSMHLCRSPTPTVNGICVRESIFYGMQKMFAQIRSCLYQITYKQHVLMLRLKRTIVNNQGVCMPTYQ